MKTIQVTIDEELLERLDRQLAGASKARSAFIRAAIERELRRAEICEMERRWKESYARQPADSDELEAWESAQEWGETRQEAASR